jgi:DNA-binding LytR/AlgR family response regulator
MIRCIALDDEPIALNVLQMHCAGLPLVQLDGVFTRPSEARAYLQENPCDLLFLDIEMPDVNGLDFFRSLPQEVMLILTTAYTHYAAEGFNLNAVDYLQKPISFARFQQAVEKAIAYHDVLMQRKQQKALFVYSEYTLVRIDIDDILYLESMSDYVKIHTQSRAKPVLTLSSLKEMLTKLPAAQFVRIHRSYAVAVQRISAQRSRTVLIGDSELPLGDTYREAFRKRLIAEGFSPGSGS